jgi:hypothetical protein
MVSSISMALVGSFVSPGVEEENDALIMASMLGHDPAGIRSDDRSAVKRVIATDSSLVLKAYLSRTRFAVKWITNDFINLSKESESEGSSFIQC